MNDYKTATLDKAQLASIFIFCGILLSGISSLSLKGILYDEDCQPVQPTDICKIAHYRVSIYDITEAGAPRIGVLRTSCVYIVGEGRHKRYRVSEGIFTAAGRTDVFDYGTEFPVAQTQVCEVKI